MRTDLRVRGAPHSGGGVGNDGASPHGRSIEAQTEPGPQGPSRKAAQSLLRKQDADKTETSREGCVCTRARNRAERTAEDEDDN